MCQTSVNLSPCCIKHTQMPIISLSKTTHKITHFPYTFFGGEFPDNCSSQFLLVAGSERLYRKGFLSNIREASQDQKRTIPCALQAGFSEENQIFQEKFQRWRPGSVMSHCEFMKTRIHHESFLRNVRLFSDLYLFSEPNNYCFDRAAPGKLSKCNWRNTVIVLKILVKCHKCLKETELLPRSYSIKKLF